jgi:LPXTG-site transpeptidase (sortase) family protein
MSILRWASRLLKLVGILAIVLGLSYGILIRYLAWREEVAPSTSQVLVLRDGQTIPLVQPDPSAEGAPGPGAARTPPALLPPPPVPDGTPPPPGGGMGDGGLAGGTLVGRGAAALWPPLRITIPKLGLNWPVVLSTNEQLPRFKAVGWLLGSAYPGRAGNLVLFGHLDGPYSTFGRLKELQAGDLFHIVTAAGSQDYRVRRTFLTTPADVGVLAATRTATATLITCAGQWIPRLRTYDQRLIVVADYVQP